MNPVTQNSDGPANTSPSLTSLALWTVWFALLSGLLQSIPAHGVHLISKRLIFQNPDGVWMAPVINLLLMVAAWLIVSVIAGRSDRAVRARLGIGTLLFLVFVGPLAVVPGLHVYSAYLLAAGLATAGSGLITGRPYLFHRLVRRTLPWALAATGAFALLVATPTWFSNPSAADSRDGGQARPNVILLVLDTVRASELSFLGYDRQTSPRLDALAKAGVVFEHAISPSPYTLPAHAAFFTGRYPRELSTDWLVPLDGTYPTLAETLALEGYATGGFVANLIYGARYTGLSRGFEHYADHPLSLASLIESSWPARTLANAVRRAVADNARPLVRKTASDVNAEFLEWMASLEGQPFFAFLNYFDTHDPYRPPTPFNARFGDGGPPPPLDDGRRYSEEELRRLRDAYDGAISYLDDQVGQLLDVLGEKGVLDNTIVVVVSDHGEQFGEHGLVDHANSLYRPLLHVPLIISSPSLVPAGVRIDEPVTLVDLPATILDLARVRHENRRLPGHSLAVNWGPVRPDVPSRPIVSEVSKGINTPAQLPISKGPMQSLVADGMHYIRNGDGREELYDFRNDVRELLDLSSRPESQAALGNMRTQLDRALKSAPGAEVSFGGSVVTTRR